MKTLSNYMMKESTSRSLNEAAGMTSLASYDEKKVAKLPEYSKNEKDNLKYAPAGFKTFQKKIAEIGCTFEMPFIEMIAIKGRIGAVSYLEIQAPRSSKTNFWLRVNERSCMLGFKEDFLKITMSAQIQPDMIGKDLEDAVAEIKKVSDFVKWYNSQDPAKLFPVLCGRKD